MEDIGCGFKNELGKRPSPEKICPRVLKDVPGNEGPVVHSESIVELSGDNSTTQLNWYRLDRQLIAGLINRKIEKLSCRELFLSSRIRRSFCVKKSDFSEQCIRGWRGGGAVDNADVMAEIAGDTGQHACVGGNARPLCEREIQAVKDDPMRHAVYGRRALRRNAIFVDSGRSIVKSGSSPRTFDPHYSQGGDAAR